MQLFSIIKNNLLPSSLLIGLLVTILVCVTSYYLWDRALVLWAAEHQLRSYPWLHWLQQLPELFIIITLLTYLAFPWLYLKRTIGLHRQALLVSTLSFTISGFIKEVLKFVFGRYWPATWSQNNPSFLTDNVYGFNWFHQGVWYQSFPSGHTVAIFAVATVIWFYYPRWRWLCYLTTVAVIVGLIGNYYHFLSDIILGAYLGIATSAVVLAVWSKRVSRKEK